MYLQNIYRIEQRQHQPMSLPLCDAIGSSLDATTWLADTDINGTFEKYSGTVAGDKMRT